MAAAIPFVILAFTAYSSIQQGEDAARSQEIQRNSALRNEEISRKAAQSASAESAAAQSAKRRQVRQILANQRAAAVQSGTGTGGSNEALLDQSSTLAELDVLNVAYEGALRSRGFNIQSDSDNLAAGIYGLNAKTSRRAGYLGAGKSLLSGGYDYYKSTR